MKHTKKSIAKMLATRKRNAAKGRLKGVTLSTGLQEHLKKGAEDPKLTATYWKLVDESKSAVALLQEKAASPPTPVVVALAAVSEILATEELALPSRIQLVLRYLQRVWGHVS